MCGTPDLWLLFDDAPAQPARPVVSMFFVRTTCQAAAAAAKAAAVGLLFAFQSLLVNTAHISCTCQPKLLRSSLFMILLQDQHHFVRIPVQAIQSRLRTSKQHQGVGPALAHYAAHTRAAHAEPSHCPPITIALLPSPTAEYYGRLTETGPPAMNFPYDAPHLH